MSKIVNMSNWSSSEGDGPIVTTVVLDYFTDEESVTWFEQIFNLMQELDKGGKMARYDGKFELAGAAVKVADLWAIFPELEGEESPAEFAEKVRLAADLARLEDAHDDLRARLADAFWRGHAHGATGEVAQKRAEKNEKEESE